MFVQLCILLGMLVFTFILRKNYSNRKAPPGPFQFPVVGSLPLLGENPSKTFFKWSKKYGPIISVRLGSFPAVILNDEKIIREGFNLPVFAGRPHLRMFDEYSKRKGLLFGDTSKNREQRQFTQINIRDFGYRNKSIESKILDEVSDLVKKLSTNTGKKVKVEKFFNLYVFNALWQILFSERFEEGDPQLKHHAELVSKASSLPSTMEMLSFFMPWLTYLLPNWSGYNAKMENFFGVADFIKAKIESHKKTWIKGQPRDFNDNYFDKIEDTKDEASSFHYSDENQITITNSDIFATGVDTIATGLEWLFLYMAANPDVQKELRKEIHTVIGTSRLPSLTDRPSMPFTEAVIYELLRKSSFVPMGLFHRTMDDVHNFHGYFIPKNTIVISDLYSVHHRKEAYRDPENFRPSRFIGEDGKLKKYDEFMPFAVGRRNCVGELFAKDSLFLYTVSIFQKYKIEFPPGEKHPSPDACKFGIITGPKPFHVIFKDC